MSGAVVSERELEVLRSFARRIDPADAGAHNNLGVLYHQKGLVAEAIAQFTQALELDPRMDVARGNLEIAYKASGYYDRLVAERRERLRREPGDREARWELGRAYAALGHHAEAAQEFETLLAWHPNDVAALLQLGLAERARGRFEAAAEWFSRACERDPDSSVALFHLGETLYHRGLNDQALAALTAAVERNPDNADAHYLLAFLYGDIGRQDDARAATKRALALNPALARAQANLALDRVAGGPGRDQPASNVAEWLDAEARPRVVEGRALAHYSLGLAFRQRGYFAEALREYRLALDAGEDRRLNVQAMAEVHLLRRDLAAALELYDALVRDYPDSPKLANEQGVCLHQAGRRDDALAAYRRAVALEPGYALAWNNLGVLHAHRAEPAEAADAFGRALRAPAAPPAARLNLGLLHLQRRQLPAALEAYREALARSPAPPAAAAAWNGVGLVLMELKRWPDARTAFARAVEADDRLAGAHYNLSFALSQLGDFDAALRATKRALELEPFYVPQKYALTLDLQFEDPTIAVPPALDTDIAVGGLGAEFAFDSAALDRLFTELAPTHGHAGAGAGNGASDGAGDPLALARDYVSKGLLERAGAELARAQARGATTADVGVLMGDVFARRGLHGEALERYREARAASPDGIEAALGEVRALLALDRAVEAAPLAEAVAARAPELIDAQVARARTRLELGDAVGALEAAAAAQGLAPGRPDLYHLRARIAHRLGDIAGARDAYREALRIDGAQVQIRYELGRLEEERADDLAARAAYEQALEHLPTFTAAALALAGIVGRTESAAAAVNVVVTVLETDPYDLDALALLGRLLLDDGRTDAAREALDRVLRFDPDHASALFHRGVVRARERCFPEAVDDWNRVVQLDPAGTLAADARSRVRSARDLQHIFATVAD
ncbi:MAG TPA: tetratricopeptide repeat protein [Gemmatimonadales bacterium]|nr:tetratricopeptide repeat protein [Gemmatimonadales bacterium]